ncbi:hypothetical protein IFVP5_C290003 [Vibrio parahaemolyticus]
MKVVPEPRDLKIASMMEVDITPYKTFADIKSRQYCELITTIERKYMSFRALTWHSVYPIYFA